LIISAGRSSTFQNHTKPLSQLPDVGEIRVHAIVITSAHGRRPAACELGIAADWTRRSTGSLRKGSLSVGPPRSLTSCPVRARTRTLSRPRSRTVACSPAHKRLVLDSLYTRAPGYRLRQLASTPCLAHKHIPLIMSAPSPLPSTDPRAAAGSLALQVAASMIPVPLPWLYVAMGVGCAVFVHTEVDMCGKRKRHLARTRARTGAGAKRLGAVQEQQQLQQEEARNGCWISRWCSPSTSSAKPSTSQHPPANGPETLPADQFCLVRTMQGCLNHRRNRQEVGAGNETWSVAQPTTFDSSSSSVIGTSRVLPTSIPRTEDEADEELASAVLPQASHLSSAMDHLRFVRPSPLSTCNKQLKLFCLLRNSIRYWFGNGPSNRSWRIACRRRQTRTRQPLRHPRRLPQGSQRMSLTCTYDFLLACRIVLALQVSSLVPLVWMPQPSLGLVVTIPERPPF